MVEQEASAKQVGLAVKEVSVAWEQIRRVLFNNLPNVNIAIAFLWVTNREMGAMARMELREDQVAVAQAAIATESTVTSPRSASIHPQP